MMKKVLLTKSQHVRVTTPDIMKKAPNGATTPPIISSSSVRVMHMPTNVITNTYMQRKSFQSIYEDIFKLLMRLPDKALQQRVIDAINGRNDKSAILNPNQCKQCSINEQKQKALKVNASTQTEIIETKELEIAKHIQPVKSVKKEECRVETKSAVVSSSGNEIPTETAKKVPRKRGRKRNTCVPQVVKRSTAQMALQEREEKQLTPLPPQKKKKVDNSEPSPSASPIPQGSPMQRRDSVMSNLSNLSDINVLEMCNQMDNYINNDNERTILLMMEKEFLRAEEMSVEGLLPIHDAMLVGDVQCVQRQVYVWTKLKGNKDFNEILSADGEDCLQLALTNDCDPEIVRVVLNAGVLPNHIYEDANTAVHIAIINNVQLESLRELMQRIDLNLLLLTNDDGYTALHIAVRHNRYRMAEIICDTIDQRELGAPIYRRASDEVKETNDEKTFAKYYERACDRLEHNKEKLLRRQLKHEILNATEARAGNASLFYAVEGELEHLCYFLLAHLANPDEENLSGHSPKSFHYEYARVLRINLKVSRIMDKVNGILNGKTR
ncbi:uncharacterized protein Charon [Drosophila montana]|uniref:uncharacterized protein Charon n=1 Tax=Drosophila montana TaxID=40370 RepID=UPI00313F31CD